MPFQVKISLFLSCTDQLELPVACNVKNEYNQKQLELGQGENSRVVHECEALSFQVFSTKEQFMGTLNMSGIIVCTDQSTAIPFVASDHQKSMPM